eukprot:gene5296-biopygen5289
MDSDSVAFSRLGEVNWDNPHWPLLDEVDHELREERCADESGANSVNGAAAEAGVGEQAEVLPPQMWQESEWDLALEERWRGERRERCGTHLALKMHGAAGHGAAEAMIRLYTAHLMAKGTVTAANLQPYLSAIDNCHEDTGKDGPAKGRNVPTDARAERARRRGPDPDVAAGQTHGGGLHPVGRADAELFRACTYVVLVCQFGVAGHECVHAQGPHQRVQQGDLGGAPQGARQEACAPEQGLGIPANGVDGLVQLLQHWERARDALWQQEQFIVNEDGRGSYRRLAWEKGKLASAQANDWVVLGKLGCVPPEGGHFSGHNTCKGTCAYSLDVCPRKGVISLATTRAMVPVPAPRLCGFRWRGVASLWVVPSRYRQSTPTST